MDEPAGRRRLVVGGVVGGAVVAALVLVGAFWWGGATGGREAGPPTADAPAGTPATMETVAGEWTYVTVPEGVPREGTGRIIFDDGQASSTLSCSYSSADMVWGPAGALRFERILSSRAACLLRDGTVIHGPDLLAVRSAVLVDDILHLRNAEGATVVELRRTDTEALGETPVTATNAHGSWDVVAFDGLSHTEVAAQDAYVTLDENGDATGDDGCNSFFADVTWGQPGELRLDSFGSTLIGCVPHTSVIGALQEVTSAVLLDPDTLHLRDAAGATVVELRRTGVDAETSAAVDGTWRVEDARFTIVGGRMHGVDRCNSMSGEVVRGDDGSLRFDELVVTAAGCGSRLGQALVDTRSAEVRDDDELALRAGEGTTLVELSRVHFPERAFVTALGDGTRIELVIADGRVRSPAGCDGLVGTYEATDDGTFAFEPGMARGGGCDRSGELAEELVAAVRWSGSPTTLDLWAADGTRLVHLGAAN